MIRNLVSALCGAVFVGTISFLPAEAEGPVSVVPLFKGGETILGQKLAYRDDGDPVVNAEIITVAPGAEIPNHIHLTPLISYVLEGAITVHYDGGVVNTYKEGQALLEAVNVWHRGVNEGDVPVRLLVINLGVSDAPNTIAR